MTSSADPIQKILGPEGLLAGSLREFEFRSSQVHMAGLISAAIERESQAIVEAGTGTGKTLGYLVPLVLSGKKTVISTATKTLQEQIFFKDLPLLAQTTGQEIDAMLMKGRKNYLCLHRYHQAVARAGLLKNEKKLQKKIQDWLADTEYADRAEIAWMGDEDPLWDAISSTSEQCLGSDCLHWAECYLNHLRWRAAQARLIIVNHHLFFADLMVKRSGFGEIIPRFQVLLFDEAHSLEDTATSYLGMSVSTKQVLDLAGDLDSRGLDGTGAKGKGAKGIVDRIRTASEHLREEFAGAGERGRLGREALMEIGKGPAQELRLAIRSLLRNAEDMAEREEGFMQVLIRRATELEENLTRILSVDDPRWLTWFENRKRTLVLHASPLDISESMRELLYRKVRTVLFTSATLSTGGHFDYFRERLGIDEKTLTGIYPSHFDFENHSLLYIPRDLPTPNEHTFAERMSERIAEILGISAGRALVLFTSYHNLHLAHRHLSGNIPYTLYRQGDAPRSALLDAFRTDTHSVLLATGSFWEGVDVPGEALSCLIIDKLPFDSPGDPLVAARIEAVRAGGGNPFMHYQLPAAIISLKQGLGRLIRNGSDRGVLAILDVRMINSRYGRFFLDSLPKMPLTHNLGDVEGFFAPG